MAKSKVQQEQAEELVEELQVELLRKQLKTIKKLPSDFRDMEVMSDDWQSFAEIMGPEKKAEMLKWAKGGVLCLAPLNDLERRVLSGFGTLALIDEMNTPFSFEAVLLVVQKYNVSFIYASEWPKHVIAGMNWLASHYGWNFRFKGQLMSGRGMPLGI